MIWNIAFMIKRIALISIVFLVLIYSGNLIALYRILQELLWFVKYQNYRSCHHLSTTSNSIIISFVYFDSFLKIFLICSIFSMPMVLILFIKSNDWLYWGPFEQGSTWQLKPHTFHFGKTWQKKKDLFWQVSFHSWL